MSEIMIYTSTDGHIELEVNLANDTLWLSQQQMAALFGTKRQAITKHLKNIFLSKELNEGSTCSILEHIGKNKKIYKTKFYSLDAVISVGYRVNSQQATQFRIWATQVLKNHLIQGYSLYKPRLAQQGLHELQLTIELLQKTLMHHEFINDIGSEAIQLILSYTKTWHLLLAYDENRLALPEQGRITITKLDDNVCIRAIETLKQDLFIRQEATQFFGTEREKGTLTGILGNNEQTFDTNPLYKSVEEKAAHLLYFIIKDHPFIDGNKRIGCFIFLLYLKLQNAPIKLNENGLIALALLVAESHPSQKDIIIRLIANLLIEIEAS